MTAATGQLFSDEFHNEFGTWMLGYTPYGGGDYGDVAAVAAAVGDGDDTAFYDAWVAAGDRSHVGAAVAESAGHRASASDLYLRASAAYASAYHPLYGTPVDPRLLEAYRRQVAAFDRGMELRAVPVHPVEIPFEGARMRSYVLPAEGRAQEVRPLIIMVNGYDATVTDVYFALGVAAARRGYHVLMFDGPGQGGMLYEQGIALRPDWETVVSAVIDYAVTLPIVDTARIAVSGWSLGGYLAPRAASGEPRISACIADPGQWDLAEAMQGFARRFGATAEQAAHPEDLDDDVLEKMMDAIRQNRAMRWSIEQRGFWANGVSDLRGLIGKTMQFTLRDRVGQIRCPVLLTRAENDPLAAAVGDFAAALPNATVLDFTAAEGAGDHCEMMNRSLVNRRALDWLDEVFAVGAPT
jgi:predicted alpha/beta-fold hydrolase